MVWTVTCEEDNVWWLLKYHMAWKNRDGAWCPILKQHTEVLDINDIRSKEDPFTRSGIFPHEDKCPITCMWMHSAPEQVSLQGSNAIGHFHSSHLDILVCSIGSQDSYGVNIYAVTCILFAIELSEAGHALNHTRVTVLLRDHSSEVTPDSQYSSKG